LGRSAAEPGCWPRQFGRIPLARLPGSASAGGGVGDSASRRDDAARQLGRRAGMDRVGSATRCRRGQSRDEGKRRPGYSTDRDGESTSSRLAAAAQLRSFHHQRSPNLQLRVVRHSGRDIEAITESRSFHSIARRRAEAGELAELKFSQFPGRPRSRRSGGRSRRRELRNSPSRRC
jgi:hypothetical protein